MRERERSVCLCSEADLVTSDRESASVCLCERAKQLDSGATEAEIRSIAALLLSHPAQRGVAHLTATLTVNRVSMPDPMINLGRATVFQKEITFAGFGLDAKKCGRIQRKEERGREIERERERATKIATCTETNLQLSALQVPRSPQQERGSVSHPHIRRSRGRSV